MPSLGLTPCASGHETHQRPCAALSPVHPPTLSSSAPFLQTLGLRPKLSPLHTHSPYATSSLKGSSLPVSSPSWSPRARLPTHPYLLQPKALTWNLLRVLDESAQVSGFITSLWGHDNYIYIYKSAETAGENPFSTFPSVSFHRVGAIYNCLVTTVVHVLCLVWVQGLLPWNIN